jgi:hypothetical protein
LTLINNYDTEYQADFSSPSYSGFMTETVYESVDEDVFVVIHNDGTVTIAGKSVTTKKPDFNCVTNNYPWIDMKTGYYYVIYNGIVYSTCVE